MDSAASKEENEALQIMRRQFSNKTHKTNSVSKPIDVGIGEIAVGYFGDILKIASLGSCIGLVFYPKHLTGSDRFAILAHIMLAHSPSEEVVNKRRKSLLARGTKIETMFGPAKYADKAVPSMISKINKLGYLPNQLEAKMVGGAKLFGTSNGLLQIGRENAQFTMNLLKDYEIHLKNYHTGGDTGMSVVFNVSNYELIVTPAGGFPIVL
ncbi:MAG: chemotaxis protein CheD [Candidatus Hodarchaeota archaeon]